MLQFHGNESAEFCRRFKDYRVIKAFRVKNAIDCKKILKYKPFAYLFDAFSPKKIGGTGKKFDWALVRHIHNITRPVFLSGGLTETNIEQAIEAVHPDWIDVCSSVESSPGKKDHKKVRNFIKQAKLRA